MAIFLARQEAQRGNRRRVAKQRSRIGLYQAYLFAVNLPWEWRRFPGQAQGTGKKCFPVERRLPRQTRGGWVD